MRLKGETKSVLDERELQELYGIEHRGLWLMYGLLCAAVIVQMLLGADFKQMAGEWLVIVVSSVVLIVAYARRGIWDDRSRPSVRGNAAYSALCAGVVALIAQCIRRRVGVALFMGAAMFALSFCLLTGLMLYLRRRQERRERELEQELEQDEEA